MHRITDIMLFLFVALLRLALTFLSDQFWWSCFTKILFSLHSTALSLYIHADASIDELLYGWLPTLFLFTINFIIWKTEFFWLPILYIHHYWLATDASRVPLKSSTKMPRISKSFLKCFPGTKRRDHLPQVSRETDYLYNSITVGNQSPLLSLKSSVPFSIFASRQVDASLYQFYNSAWWWCLSYQFHESYLYGNFDFVLGIFSTVLFICYGIQ